MQSEGFLPLPALAFQKNEFGQDKYAVYFKPDDSKLKLVVNKGFGKPQELDIDQGVLSDLVCSAVLRYKMAALSSWSWKEHRLASSLLPSYLPKPAKTVI